MAGHPACAGSDTLTLTRNQLTEVERKDEILRKNNSDREFLIILSDIRRHTFLLRDYFATLNSLAESGAPEEIGKSADALYGSLAALFPKIESANINGWPVKNFISPVTTLAVAKFQQAALEKELKGIEKARGQRRVRRGRRGLPVISIVGYTNAGKSTLLNAVTKSAVFTEYRLFATLDPKSSRLRFPRVTRWPSKPFGTA